MFDQTVDELDLSLFCPHGAIIETQDQTGKRPSQTLARTLSGSLQVARGVRQTEEVFCDTEARTRI
jgi:hypothetical protein